MQTEWPAERLERLPRVMISALRRADAAVVVKPFDLDMAETLGKIPRVVNPLHTLLRRAVLLGHSGPQHVLAVMFTERGDVVRLISARRATRRERCSPPRMTHRAS